MKKILHTIIALNCSLFCIGCKKTSVTGYSQSVSVENRQLHSDNLIEIDDAFAQEPNAYYIYIFSSSCGHCISFKPKIEEFQLRPFLPMFFVEFSSKVRLSADVSATIGTECAKDISIIGTPTLLLIVDRKLTLNIAGVQTITHHLFPNEK